jgi:hypothetical protein
MEETVEKEEIVYPELGIQSDVLTSEQISSISGIPCDNGWAKGATMPPKHTARYPHYGWVIKTSLPEEATIEDHVQSLLRRLELARGKIRQISDQAEVLVSCVIETTEVNPSFVLDPKVVASIAEMGAGLRVDVYAWEEDPQTAGGPGPDLVK